MKKLAGILVLLLLTSVCTTSYAELTPEEETELRQILTNKDKLIQLWQRSTELSNIADTANAEGIPIEIERLRNERQALIVQRDGELQVQKNTNSQALQTIVDTYEPLIDAKESEIAQKQAELDSVINP